MVEPSEHPATQYEESDISIKATAIVAFSTLVVLIALALGIGILFQYDFDRHILVDKASDLRSTFFDVTRIFPEPRLQISPESDWKHYREAEEKILSRYEWMERDRYVRIPIEAAMKRFVDRQKSLTRPSLHEPKAKQADPSPGDMR